MPNAGPQEVQLNLAPRPPINLLTPFKHWMELYAVLSGAFGFVPFIPEPNSRDHYKDSTAIPP